MATYTIVDKDKDPLEPGEIHAGDVIQVSDGDVFIIDPSANANITFEADSGAPADFDIVFDDSNTNDFDINIQEGLIPSVNVADSVDLTDIDLKATDADGVQFTAGDNVSFGKFEGSTDGSNVIVIGNGFTTTQNWKFGEEDDTLIVGDDATFADIDTGAGNDTVIFGDRATIHNIDTKGGNDDVTFGDDLDANDVKTAEGDDTVRSGSNAQANKFDGGDGNDTHNSQTTGTNSSNFESNNVVCFSKGMTIETINGPVKVENLRKGMLVETIDHGYQPIVWVGSMRLEREALDADHRRRPIRISAGALGPNIPSSDLIVSPQHRVLVRSPIVRRMFGHSEIMVPALVLTELPCVDVLHPADGVEYFRFLLDRHEVVLSHDVEIESLFLGIETLKTLNPKALLEIEALGHNLASQGSASNLARPSPKDRAKMRHLIQRHVRNRKFVQNPLERVDALMVG